MKICSAQWPKSVEFDDIHVWEFVTRYTVKCPLSLLNGVCIKRVNLRENMGAFRRDKWKFRIHTGIRIKRVSVVRGSILLSATFPLHFPLQHYTSIINCLMQLKGLRHGSRSLFKELKRVFASNDNGPVLVLKTVFWHWNCFLSSVATDG